MIKTFLPFWLLFFVWLPGLPAFGQQSQSLDLPGLRQQHETLNTAFHNNLEALAVKCEQQSMPEAAALTRAAILKRDPARQYIYMPPAKMSPDEDRGNGLQKAFRQRFREIQQGHAAALFDLAKQAATNGLGAEAYQLLHETLVYDPQHQQGRAALGFRQHDQLGWVRSAKPTTARESRTRQKTIGWEKGTFWEINSPHFRIYSAAGKEAGLKLAEELEQTYRVWRQVFFDYWSNPRQIQRWLSGESTDKSSSKQYEVILFRDKQQYVTDLAEVDNIGISSGYYDEGKRVSLFYWGDDPLVQNWRHEIVHQLLQENAGSNKTVADRGRAWLVEGIAMYFETMLVRNNYVVLGGFDATRLQYARLRCKREGYFVPMQELNEMGRKELQDPQTAGRLYTQSSGVSQFLFTGEQGRYRKGFINFIKEFYKQRRVKSTLAEQTLPLDQLDRRYKEFLNVDKNDLANHFLNRDPDFLSLGRAGLKSADVAAIKDCRRLQWLELSENPLTDDSLDHLRNMTQLTQLFLDVTGVTDAGMPKIAGLTTLQELDLATTRITDSGVRQLRPLQNLQYLWLASSRVTDGCIEHLAEFSNLKLVDLRQTGVTESGVQKLKAARPKLQIMH